MSTWKIAIGVGAEHRVDAGERQHGATEGEGHAHRVAQHEHEQGPASGGERGRRA
jgi:hypothetical protein